MRLAIAGGAISCAVVGFVIYMSLGYWIKEDKPNPCAVAQMMSNNDLVYNLCGLELVDELQASFDLDVMEASTRAKHTFFACYKSNNDKNKTISTAIFKGRESLRLSFCATLRQKGQKYFKPTD